MAGSEDHQQDVRREGGDTIVMIVEDEALIAWDLADGFQDQGFRIAGPFATCAAALHSLSTELPDLAIVDSILSDGPCLELALELLRLGVPLLIYSGEAKEAYAPQLEGVPRIEKPSPVEVIVQTARGLLAARAGES